MNGPKRDDYKGLIQLKGIGMKTLTRTFVAAIISAVLVGCGSESSPTASTPKATGAPAAPLLPATLFLATAPPNAKNLREAKPQARVGDEVVIEARVGGRVEPFIDGRAMFLVVDTKVPSCKELHGDMCKTPWDYCCEPRESLIKHSGTIQVVDAEGRVLQISLRGVKSQPASW